MIERAPVGIDIGLMVPAGHGLDVYVSFEIANEHVFILARGLNWKTASGVKISNMDELAEY
jgi:hypothetical protein